MGPADLDKELTQLKVLAALAGMPGGLTATPTSTGTRTPTATPTPAPRTDIFNEIVSVGPLPGASVAVTLSGFFTKFTLEPFYNVGYPIGALSFNGECPFAFGNNFWQIAGVVSGAAYNAGNIVGTAANNGGAVSIIAITCRATVTLTPNVTPVATIVIQAYN